MIDEIDRPVFGALDIGKELGIIPVDYQPNSKSNSRDRSPELAQTYYYLEKGLIDADKFQSPNCPIRHDKNGNPTRKGRVRWVSTARRLRNSFASRRQDPTAA